MTDSTSAQLRNLGVGEKIKALRKSKEFSIAQLASKASLTSPLLEQIEKDDVFPNLGTLMNIAKALRVEVSTFLVREEPLEKIELTRCGERLAVDQTIRDKAVGRNYSFQALSSRLKDKRMKPFFVEFDTTAIEVPHALTHSGEEFCFCLKGRIQFTSEDRTLILNPGDALHFYSDIPHAFMGLGTEKPRAIFVMLPDRA